MSPATAAASHTIKTAAGKIIQRRATTGSVSSVFYLRQAGMKEQANVAENAFLIGIGAPTALLGVAGLYQMAKNGKL
eukprot:CAMPEP_0176002146 /NCGR_PEP_ID=MMETSP0120_2-20121206/495_1 /TAXON_ID=160619 /ORGANISM="Kryptoperidinium foliaceum, Strain CCMP 1326" /LENGTH=76 /DNA_ID=CAMNT_0017334723 /DNA_START=1 /DNA_END=231 /DNA_ORIENTATION=-